MIPDLILAAVAEAMHTPDPAPVVAAGVSGPPTSREAAAARSARAQDSRGPLPSLYRGIYFRADQERFRLCVGHREGGFIYPISGGAGGHYYGTYQMSAPLARGATWMMAAESRRTHDGLRSKARALLNVPADRWSRYWQDRAFYTVLNFDGPYSGRNHWAGGRWAC